MNKLTSLIILLACIACAQQPLVSFEDGENWQAHIRKGGSLDFKIVQENPNHGQNAARAFFPGSEIDTWPGFYVVVNQDNLADNNILAFNAWHEEPEDLLLSVRVDFKDGTRIFLSAPTLPPRQKTKHKIYLPVKDLDGNKKTINTILVYRSKPRKNATIWFDAFEYASSDTLFTPIEYVAQPGIKPNQEELEFGAQIFQRPWMEHVFPNVKPTQRNPVKLTFNACPGEAEPATLSVHALNNVNAAKATITKDLEDDKGNKLAKDAFQILIVQCLDKRPTYPDTRRYVNLPVVLEKLQQAPIPKDTTLTFWVDATIPKDARPGTYNGSLALKLDNKEATIPVAVNVRNFTLQEPDDMFWGEYFTSFFLGETLEEQNQFIKDALLDMRQNGMTSLGICFGLDLSKSTYENGIPKYDIPEDAHLTTTLNTYRDLKFPQPIIILADMGQAFCSVQKLPFGTQQYKEAYQAFWKSFQQEAKKRNWPEIIVQPVDEPGWKDQGEKDRNLALLKYLKEIPGMRTEQDGPGDDYFHNVAGPWSDVWNFNGATGTPEVIEKLHRENKIPLIYNCDVESYRPATARYTTGFFQARSNTRGSFNWAYCSFANDPYSDFDSKHGDWMHIYPKTNKRPGGPSIGWRATREGIDDFKYIATLKALIKQSKSPKTKEAQKILDEVLNSINYSKNVRNAGSFQKLPTQKGVQRIAGAFTQPIGWNLQNYDDAREIIATQFNRLIEDKQQEQIAQKPEFNIVPTTLGNFEKTNQIIYSIAIPTLDTSPKIDGKLDDPCWNSAAQASNFTINTGGTPKAQTQFKIFADKSFLYIACKCDEPYMNLITANITRNNGPLWLDDCIEIFFDTDRNGKDFKQVIVNVLGFNATSASIKNWKPTIQSATERLDDAWTAEVKIPLESLNIKGNTFGFNLCRERRPTEIFELSCWAPTGPKFATPEKFGTATFGHTVIVEVNDVACQVGTTAFSLKCNPKGKTTFIATWTLEADGKISQLGKSQTAIDEPATITFSKNIPKPGTLQVDIVATDNQNKEIDRLAISRTIPNPILIAKTSPFSDASNFTASIKLNYKPEDNQKLAFKIMTKEQQQTIPIQSGIDNFILKQTKGTLNQLDKLEVTLIDATSNKTIASDETTILAR